MRVCVSVHAVQPFVRMGVSVPGVKSFVGVLMLTSVSVLLAHECLPCSRATYHAATQQAISHFSLWTKYSA